MSSSMTAVGGTRSVPMSTGSGSGLPDETTLTARLTSSVVVRLVLEPPPGRNSDTSPVTVTLSPTWALPRKTKMPSLVASEPSGDGRLHPEAVAGPWR